MKLRRKLNCILLVDDDYDDNYFHKIVIKQMDIAEAIDEVTNGLEALQYLQTRKTPDLIFLDINMPKMNGWEFLEQYKFLEAEKKAKIILMILTTSANPDEIAKAKKVEEVTGFITKPLTRHSMTEILEEHFKECI